MIKLLGAFFILSASLLYGYSLRGKYLMRIASIDDLRLYLTFIENEIRYSGHDLIQIVEHTHTLSQRCNIQLFETFLRLYKTSDGKPLSEIWHSSIKESLSGYFYLKNDIDKIKKFGDVLGCGDVETQLKNIAFFQNELSELLNSAKDEYNKKGTSVIKISICIGALIVILLL